MSFGPDTAMPAASLLIHHNLHQNQILADQDQVTEDWTVKSTSTSLEMCSAAVVNCEYDCCLNTALQEA